MSLSTNSLFTLFSNKPLTSLKKLILDECPALTDEVLSEISSNCPNLITYSSAWCPQVRSPGARSLLLGCLRLRSLDLTGLKTLTDDFLEPVLAQPSQQSALSSLKFMSLEMCDYVSDKLLAEVKRKYP
jgi:hypothetical protein